MQSQRAPAVNVIKKHWMLFGVLLVAFALRLWHIAWALPELYEEAIPLRFGMKLWEGSNAVDYNFFVYPALSYYVQYIVQSLHFVIGYIFGLYASLQFFLKAYESNPTTFVILARLVTIAFDTGTIVVAYLVGQRVADRRVAILVAFLIGINRLHISEAHLINVDTPLAFFSMLSLFFLYQMYTDPKKKWYLWSGISIGLAAATKYNGAVLMGAFIIIHFLRASSLRVAVRSLNDASLVRGILTVLTVFVLLNTMIVTHADDFLLKFKGTERHMEYGHLGVDANTSTIGFYLLQSLPSNLGWMLTIVIMVSFVHLLVSRKKINYVMLTIPAIFLIVLGSWQMRAERYLLPVVPFLILIGVIGLVALSDYMFKYISSGRFKRLAQIKFFPDGLIVLFTFIVTLSASYDVINYHRSLSSPNTRTLCKEWIRENIPRGSAIATGPFGVELADSEYITLLIPFNAVQTEKTAPFYNTKWFEDVNLVITTDYDYSRYAQDPARFHDILPFYDTLRKYWIAVQEIHPMEEGTGPSFWLYKPPVGIKSDRIDQQLLDRLYLTVDSTHIVSFLGKLSIILSEKRKYTKSEQLLDQLHLLAPGSIEILKSLIFVKLDLIKYDETLQLLQEYVKLVPRDAAMLALQGQVLLSLERTKEAEKSLREALAIDEHIESAYMDLNIIYASRDDKKMMIENLTKYYSLLPANSERAQIVKRQLDKLQR